MAVKAERPWFFSRKVCPLLIFLFCFAFAFLPKAVGKDFPYMGSVYCYGTGKPVAFRSIDITCPGITTDKGELRLKGKNVPVYAIREIAFPKYPSPSLKIKLKNGKVFQLPAKKSDVPLCIFTFKVSGGVLPLDSFDIDRVVFR